MTRDNSSADDAAWAVIRASVPGRASSALIRRTQRAWTYSHARKAAMALAAQPAVARTHLLAVMAATAGLTALILTRFPTPVAPFVWIPPAMILAVSLVVLASKVASR